MSNRTVTVTMYSNDGVYYEEFLPCLKASQVGLTTPDHVWILPSYFDPNWWKNSDANCTNEEMKNILESVIIIGPVKYPPFLLSNQVSCTD